MRGLNKVMIIGQLGRDPEMRYTPNGSPVTSFSLAVNKVSVDAQGNTKKIPCRLNLPCPLSGPCLARADPSETTSPFAGPSFQAFHRWGIDPSRRPYFSDDLWGCDTTPA